MSALPFTRGYQVDRRTNKMSFLVVTLVAQLLRAAHFKTPEPSKSVLQGPRLLTPHWKSSSLASPYAPDASYTDMPPALSQRLLVLTNVVASHCQVQGQEDTLPPCCSVILDTFLIPSRTQLRLSGFCRTCLTSL